MAVKWQDLEKLLPYIKLWAEENQQFKNELTIMFSSSPSSQLQNKEENNELINHINEIKRTTYYLKAIDTNFYKEAKIFYKYYNIQNKKFLFSLCKDFKLMRIAETENNVIDYARYLILQLENVLNFIIFKIDAHTLIQNTPEKFKDERNDLLEGKYSFFSFEGKANARQWGRNGRTYYEKDHTQLDIPLKMNFIRMHYSFRYDFKVLQEMNFLRNKASHRGEIVSDFEKIAQIKAMPFNLVKSNYMNCFKNILENIKDLNLE